VTRKQGSGSEIIASRPPEAFVQSMRSLSELFQYALDTRFDIETLAPVMLDADTAAFVPGEPGSTWLRIAGLRLQGATSEPICYTIVYCAARFSPLAEEMRETRGSIYALIEARTPERIAEAVQEISALPMPREIAEALGAKVRAPAMRILRRYLGADGSPILTSVNWHPGERFVYRMRLKRDKYR
jgi:DNA-binding GntR family transcriptional regulator